MSLCVLRHMVSMFSVNLCLLSKHTGRLAAFLVYSFLQYPFGIKGALVVFIYFLGLHLKIYLFFHYNLLDIFSVTAASPWASHFILFYFCLSFLLYTSWLPPSLFIYLIKYFIYLSEPFFRCSHGYESNSPSYLPKQQPVRQIHSTLTAVLVTHLRPSSSQLLIHGDKTQLAKNM